MANIPKIRFKGFTGEWEQRKFGELYKKNNERNENQFNEDKTISIATMTFKSEGNGAADKSIPNYKVLRVGDIAFEGHTNKNFRFGRFVLNDVGNGIMSPRFTTLRPIKKLPICFWKQYIHYEPMMRQVLVNATKAGTMMNELVIEEMFNQSIPVPLREKQQKTGTFFEKMDTLINKNQHKLESLQKFKKAMLQKMFPKAGSSQPKIRFRGFTGAWEQCKLGKLLQTLPFKAFIKTPEQDGKYEIIQQGNKPIIGYANGTPCSNYKDTVIFGDHTLSLYKPNKPFFVATDGVRIVKGKHNIGGLYLLALLEKYKPQSEGCKRYYSILSDCDCSFTADDTEQGRRCRRFQHL